MEQLNLGSAVLEAVDLVHKGNQGIKRVQYADEAVVVINIEPVKLRNEMEDKTRKTHFRVNVDITGQKPDIDAKG